MSAHVALSTYSIKLGLLTHHMLSHEIGPRTANRQHFYMSRCVPEKRFLVTASIFSRLTMQFFVSLLASAAVLAGLASAAPAPAPASTSTHDKRSIVERAGVVYNVFEHAGWQPSILKKRESLMFDSNGSQD